MPRAQLDLETVYAAIDAERSHAALRWFHGLELALFTLEENPLRCRVTPEDAGLRHLLYGKQRDVYRVIYRVVEERKEVEILHIRHGARQAFDTGDVK